MQAPPTTSTVLTIGIVGGSGSGKTTFARLLQRRLGDHLCGLLYQDSYYRDRHEYFDRDGGQVNFDHPDSLEFELLASHIRDLKHGLDIDVPVYDFVTHRRLNERAKFPCRSVVIVDGILLLTQTELRSMLDLALFIDTHEALRFQRRLNRDVNERGRTPEGVHEQFYKQVKPMHDLFVEPTRRFADRVVSGEKSFDPIVDEIVFSLKGRLPFDN